MRSLRYRKRECVVEDATELTRLGQESVVSARAGEVDELRRPAQVCDEMLQLITRYDCVAFRGDDDGRCANRARIDAVQIAGERQGEKTLGRPARGEALAMVA